MREYFAMQLHRLAKTDPKVYVIDGDLANSTKTDLVAEKLPNKFIQAGIAEQNMIGIAAGLATTGLQPWVCTFTSFLTKRALDQIIVSVAQPNLDVKLIGAYSGIMNGKVGKTHQGTEDIAIMRTIPNMKILCPADGEELKQMMSWANNYNGPVYIRMTRESNLIFGPFYQWQYDTASYIRKGRDITIISTGTHTHYALQAVEKLKNIGINCVLIHMPVIKPIDRLTIIKAAVETEYIITVEDHSIIGGLGSAVMEVVAEAHPVPVRRIGIKDVNIEAGENHELLDKYKLSTEHIINTVKRCLDMKKG